MDANDILRRAYDRAYVLSGGSSRLARKAVRKLRRDLLSGALATAPEEQEERSGKRKRAEQKGKAGDGYDSEDDDDDDVAEFYAHKRAKTRQVDDDGANDATDVDAMDVDEPTSMIGIFDVAELAQEIMSFMSAKERTLVAQVSQTAKMDAGSLGAHENVRIVKRPRYGDFEEPIDWLSILDNGVLVDVVDKVFRTRMRRDYLAGDIFENGREVIELAYVMAGLQQGNILPYMLWHFYPVDVPFWSMGLDEATLGSLYLLPLYEEDQDIGSLTTLPRRVYEEVKTVYDFVCRWSTIDPKTKEAIDFGMSLYDRVLKYMTLRGNDDINIDRTKWIMWSKEQADPGTYEESLQGLGDDIWVFRDMAASLLGKHNPLGLTLDETAFWTDIRDEVDYRVHWTARIASMPQYQRFLSVHSLRVPDHAAEMKKYLESRERYFKAHIHALHVRIPFHLLMDNIATVSGANAFSSVLDSIIGPILREDLPADTTDVPTNEKLLREMYQSDVFGKGMATLASARLAWFEASKEFSDIERILVNHLFAGKHGREIGKNEFIVFDRSPVPSHNRLWNQYETDLFWDPGHNPNRPVEYEFWDCMRGALMLAARDSVQAEYIVRGFSLQDNATASDVLKALHGRSAVPSFLKRLVAVEKKDLSDLIFFLTTTGVSEYEKRVRIDTRTNERFFPMYYEQRGLYKHKERQAPNVITLPVAFGGYRLPEHKEDVAWNNIWKLVTQVLLVYSLKYSPMIELPGLTLLRLGAFFDGRVSKPFASTDGSINLYLKFDDKYLRADFEFKNNELHSALVVAFELFILLYSLEQWPYELPPNIGYCHRVLELRNRQGVFDSMVEFIEQCLDITSNIELSKGIRNAALRATYNLVMFPLNVSKYDLETMFLEFRGSYKNVGARERFPNARQKFNTFNFYVQYF